MTRNNGDNRTPSPQKKSWWAKLIKICGITLLSAFLLFVILCSSVVWFLSPDRLTPLVEKVASENLNARVSIGKAELTFWRSFPRLKVEVTDLQIISRSLDSIPASLRASLPADADSLLSLGYFTGSINLFKIITGEIALSDVLLDSPRINLLQVNDSVSNFNIFPVSEPDTTKKPLPNISINHFAITNARPITFKSLGDTIDIALNLQTIELNDRGIPLYQLTIATDIETPLLKEVAYDKIQFNLDGRIGWSGTEPDKLSLNDLKFRMEDIDVEIDTSVDFGEELRVNDFDIRVNKLDIMKLRRHAPPYMQHLIEPLKTNMFVDIDAHITKPIVFNETLGIPYLLVTMEVPDCYIKYNDLDFHNFTTRIVASIEGDDLNRSTLDIERLVINGKAIDVDFNTRVSNMTTDPRFNGHFKGRIDFDSIPAALRRMLDAEVTGILTANTDFNLRAGDLDPKRFHKMYLDGEVDLDNFRFVTHDKVTGAYVRHSKVDFGSNESINTPTGTAIDSVLMVKISADTAYFFTEGVDTRCADLRAALGTSNTHSSSDTTVITPFGGGLSIGYLRYDSSVDSLRMRMRNVKGMASLRRFEGDKKTPLLGLKLDAGRLLAGKDDMMAAMSNAHIDVTANLTPRRRPAGTPRDSISTGRWRTESRRDSVFPSRPARHGKNDTYHIDTSENSDIEMMDFNLDNSVKSLLRRWNLRGIVTAKKGLVRTPMIHLPNRIRDLDFYFTTDSVALKNADIRIGHSDFKIVGAITNIRRALSRRHPGPVKIDFDINSDTININELVHAFTSAGTRHDAKNKGEEWLEQEADTFKDYDDIPDSIIGPILVPYNIDAGVNIHADHVVYSDVLLRRFVGEVLVYQGVVNLHNLSASTDVGSVDLSAIYAAPTPDNMSFGLGMRLNDFHIERLPQMIPALDSIMPIIKTLSGTVNADVAVTTDLTPDMYFDIQSMKAAMKFEGDSLEVHDNPTLRKLAKWLLFKNKERTIIDHLNIDVTVEDGVLNIYPFIIDIDRYKLGVMGTNTLDMNLNYHVAVLKSPIPFRFGINIKGSPDHMKFRFGGSKFKNGIVAQRDSIATNTRISLIKEMSSVFRRGLRAARLGPIDIKAISDTTYLDMPDETITHADSLLMMEHGFIERPDTATVVTPYTLDNQPKAKVTKVKKEKKQKQKQRK